MSAIILDGKRIAEDMKRELTQDPCYGQRITLAILSFNTPASQLYVKAQQTQARLLNIHVVPRLLDFDASQGDVEEVIQPWNDDDAVHGIFVHQPMPQGIDPQRVSALIDPRKDVEGIHPQNMARRFFAKARIGSCTALAVMELIESTGQSLEGKEAVVVGHSEIVGRPVSMLLLDQLATTTVCHVATQRLEEHVRRADILVVAVGKPRLIKGGWIKPGAMVIDVGINVVDGHVVGDVEFAEASKRAAYISPVPGGVGPVTVMMVMKNTVKAYRLQREADVRQQHDPA